MLVIELEIKMDVVFVDFGGRALLGIYFVSVDIMLWAKRKYLPLSSRRRKIIKHKEKW